MIFISMTNEELIEELYHKTHAKGFFHELHDKVKELQINKNKKYRHELIQVAYEDLKKIKLSQPTP